MEPGQNPTSIHTTAGSLPRPNEFGRAWALLKMHTEHIEAKIRRSERSVPLIVDVACEEGPPLSLADPGSSYLTTPARWAPRSCGRPMGGRSHEQRPEQGVPHAVRGPGKLAGAAVRAQGSLFGEGRALAGRLSFSPQTRACLDSGFLERPCSTHFLRAPGWGWLGSTCQSTTRRCLDAREMRRSSPRRRASLVLIPNT